MERAYKPITKAKERWIKELREICVTQGILYEHDDEIPDEPEKRICKVDPYSGKAVIYGIYYEYKTLRQAVKHLAKKV
jgi:hypothetical protein